jgi:hypothetical protein
MYFPIIILTRILFATCMVFVIGYVFGNFSKKPVFATITKVASVLAIVLFISANVLSSRFAYPQHHGKYGCSCYQKDTTVNR